MAGGHPSVPSPGETRHPFRVSDYAEAPVVVFWEVTKACALSCLHCRAEAQPYRHPLELSTEEGFRLLDEVRRFGTPAVVLSGGDPLMRDDIYDLIEYGIKIGLRMALSPSVTGRVTRASLARVQEAGIARLSFSLDGPSPEVHDAFRGFTGSFQRTMDRIQDVTALGLGLQVNTTVTRYNLPHLPAMAELLRDLGIALWDVFFLVPVGRGQRQDVVGAEEHEHIYQWLYEVSKEMPFAVKTTLGQPFRRVVLQNLERDGIPAGQRANSSREGSPFAASNDGKGICFISHTGEVYPSGFLPLAGGNVRQESLVDIYRTSPLFQSLRNPELLKGKCGACEYRYVCGGCRARAYAVTGDALAAEPFCVYQPRGGQVIGKPAAS